MENKAWFWLMGNNWPLQKVQPLGGKFQLMIFTSPRNGSDMFSPCCLKSARLLGLRRKYSKQRKNEVDGQKRDHVVVRLRSASWSDGRRIHDQAWGNVTVVCAGVWLRPYTAGGI